jgi:hypothetical protein
MRSQLIGLLVGSCLGVGCGNHQSPVVASGSNVGFVVGCEVTRPNGIVAGSEQPEPNSYGNHQLSLGPFGLWPDGTVVFKPGGAGSVTTDGALGMKFGWTRGVRGQLRIAGRRLDAPAPPLRSIVPNGYGEIGFQATSLIFSTPGCWEVTGRVGEASLTFVTRVVKIGDGPA